MKSRITKEQLQDEVNRLRSSEHRTLVALNDVIDGKETWFNRGAYSVAVMRVSAPDGPTVIIRFNPGGQSPYASAHSWDDVWPYARNLIPCDQEQTDYRDLMFKVQAYINRELAKLAPIAA